MCQGDDAPNNMQQLRQSVNHVLCTFSTEHSRKKALGQFLMPSIHNPHFIFQDQTCRVYKQLSKLNRWLLQPLLLLLARQVMGEIETEQVVTAATTIITRYIIGWPASQSSHNSPTDVLRKRSLDRNPIKADVALCQPNGISNSSLIKQKVSIPGYNLNSPSSSH